MDFYEAVDDFLEPRDHSGDPDADPAAVDPEHEPDPEYRELDAFPDRRWRGPRRWLGET